LPAGAGSLRTSWRRNSARSQRCACHLSICTRMLAIPHTSIVPKL
jgi:hypothetical protein